jgi:starch synthase
MRIGLLTREYPPHVYGGAGVHVGYLVPHMRELIDVDVHCFAEGEPPPRDATPHRPAPELAAVNSALRTLSVDLSITAGLAGVDLAHSHTWYTNMAGHWAKLLHDVPHVITSHSLEPRRPWKAEQLGGGYRLSSWVERTAYHYADAIIAVSDGMRGDVLACYPELDPARVHVVRNGIDTQVFHPVTDVAALADLGLDLDRPSVVFVGRVTRQKGLEHLIAAAHDIDPRAQVVLCAGAPDTPEIAESIRLAVQQLARIRGGVHWLRETLDIATLRRMLSWASVFVCPSVYEPLGIVNLEAMACATAVVASDVGGIPEVVEDGKTGLLAHYDSERPEEFERALARAVNDLLADPGRAGALGTAGRQRAVERFSWSVAAERTVAVYREVLGA